MGLQPLQRGQQVVVRPAGDHQPHPRRQLGPAPAQQHQQLVAARAALRLVQRVDHHYQLPACEGAESRRRHLAERPLEQRVEQRLDRGQRARRDALDGLGQVGQHRGQAPRELRGQRLDQPVHAARVGVGRVAEVAGRHRTRPPLAQPGGDARLAHARARQNDKGSAALRARRLRQTGVKVGNEPVARPRRERVHAASDLRSKVDRPQRLVEPGQHLLQRGAQQRGLVLVDNFLQQGPQAVGQAELGGLGRRGGEAGAPELRGAVEKESWLASDKDIDSYAPLNRTKKAFNANILDSRYLQL